MCVHIFLLVNSWERALNLAALIKKECTYLDDDGFDIDEIKLCYKGGMVMEFIGQFLVIYIFIGLYMASVWMSDPMGTQVSNYELNVDLKNLWAESLNGIDAMMEHPGIMVPDITYKRAEGTFTIIPNGDDYDDDKDMSRRSTYKGDVTNHT